MGRSQKVMLGAIVVAVLLAGGYFYWNKKSAQQATETVLKNKTDAPKGKLIQGFPADLILDSKAITDQSYSIKYDQQKQYTASFKSEMTTDDLKKAYANYLNQNGYKIVNQSSTDALVSIYATKGSTIVNAIFARVDRSTQTDVTVTYVK